MVVRVNVFAPLVIVIVGNVVDEGGAEKVPVAFAPVPLLVSVNIFDPLVMVIVPALGVAVKVPVAVFGVALVVMVKVFAPLVTVTAVADNGRAEKVPVALPLVALVVSVKVLEGLVVWTVILPVVDDSRLEKLPVWAAAVGVPAVKLIELGPLVIVTPWPPLTPLLAKVPVALAYAPVAVSVIEFAPLVMVAV